MIKKCSKCGSLMVLRSGRYGQFWGCGSYPSCKNMEKYVSEVATQELPKEEKVFIPSSYQSAILDYVRNIQSNQSLMVVAVAGSGKTTTNVEIIKTLASSGKKVLAVAFNKEIERVMKEKLQNVSVDVKTFHALGYSPCRQYFGKKFEVKDDKITLILKEIWSDSFEDNVSMIGSIKKLVGLVKNFLLTPTEEVLTNLCGNFNIDANGQSSQIFDMTRKVIEYPQNGKIDFDDMIYLPVVLNLPLPQYDVIVVDEAQDTNPVQVELVTRALKSGGNVIFVGDPAQSIYGFRGADSNAMNVLKERLHADSLPLSLSYRCPKVICTEVNKRFPEISFNVPENAKDGIMGIVTVDEMLEGLAKEKEGMVLCRVNADLVKPCYQLIAKGIKATIRGRDIGLSLMSLVHKVHPKSDESLEDIFSRISLYLDKEITRYAKTNNSNAIIALQDRYNTLVAIADDCASLDQLAEKIDSIFSDSVGTGVIFSSIHKAKGLESEVVYLLSPGKLPHPRAILDWEKAQERNLEYVCITRAKKEFYTVIE